MKIKVNIKTMSICPLAAVTTDMAKKGPVQLPMFMQFDEQRNMWMVYSEDILPANKVGRILSVEDKDMSVLETIAHDDYQMRITGMNGNYLAGEITVDEKKVTKTEDGESEELAEAWKKAMELGEPFDQEFHDTVMKFFELHKVDEDLQLRTVSGYKLPVDEDGNPVSLVKPASMLMPTDTYNEKTLYGESYAACAIRQALDGNPFILTGPKSVGKNFMTEWISYILGGVYYEISVDPDMLKSELYGDKVLDAESAKHITKEGARAYLAAQNHDETVDVNEAVNYEYWKTYNQTMRFIVESTEFKRWLRQKSGRRVLMVNEINYGNPTVLAVVFNRVAEDRPIRFVDVPGEGRIYVGRDCILTASMNEGYVGTVELNEAMRSRFGCIEIQPSASIAAILKDKIESEIGQGILADSYYVACDNLYKYMLQRAQSGGAGSAQYGDKALSIRNFGMALKSVALSHGRTKLSAQLNIQLRGQCDGANERNSLSDDIRNYIKGL